MARARSAPKVEEVAEASVKAGHPKSDDRLNEIVRKGLEKHENPSTADLMKHMQRVNENIRVGKALKELKANEDDSDFEE